MSAPFITWLDFTPDLVALARSQQTVFPFLLESTTAGKLGGYSLLLHGSDEELTARAVGEVTGPGSGKSFFGRLAEWQAKEQRAAPANASGLPFAGGWFVYLGYEIAAEIEPTLRLPAASDGLPVAFARRCPGAVIVVHGGEGEPSRACVVAESADVLAQLQDCLAEAQPADHAGPGAQVEMIEEEDSTRFEHSVRRIHEYLAAGDVFQVNISRRWSGHFASAPDPYALYRSLRRANPAPFAGLFHHEGNYLLSSSPERLVQLRGRTVETRPIAGTRPRGRDSDHDRALSEELLSNLKERAEHVMLIDLERNDLGRVCRPGTVEVNELMVVESYAHVHHIVSNVRGELAPGAGPVDAMRAVFPGGTITGCPKVRCMEIIAELEGAGRSYYTGSMGYLGRDGSMDLNILIRSMLLREGQFSFRTGAGIVADSDPQREVAETADKARGMLLALKEHTYA